MAKKETKDRTKRKVTFNDLACYMAHSADAYARSLKFIDVKLFLEGYANLLHDEAVSASNPRAAFALELTSTKLMTGEPFR